MKEITDLEREDYKDKVINAIKARLTNNDRITDLGDIGNEIGIAVGHVTCKDGKDQDIWSFEKEDFEHGFNHGYSLHDGSHQTNKQ